MVGVYVPFQVLHNASQLKT